MGMGQGVHITVFNTGWGKVDNRVLLSGGDKKNSDMPALCALTEHPTQGNILLADIAGQRNGMRKS